MRLKTKNQKGRRPLNQGRARSPLTSYYRGQNLSDEPASPFKRKTPKRKFKGYFYGVLDIILAALLIIVLAYSLMVSPHPTVHANDTTFHSLNDYQAAASAQLSSLNNRNKITFNQSALAASLKKRFPEIRAVAVELPLFSEKPTINLAVDGPSFKLFSQGTTFIIDSSGRAVTKAANSPKFYSLPLVNDDSGFRTSTGQQIMGGNEVNFIKSLLLQTKKAGIKVNSLTLPKVAQELDLRAQDQPYFVKFYLDGDVLAQTGQYLAARHHFSETNQQPSQYLDVRVPGKVFYK
jgi:hypothetical protein